MKFYNKFTTALLLLVLMLSFAPVPVQSAQAAGCYWAQFIADVTVPDGTNFAPSATFQKVWRIKNIGSCVWNANDVSLIFESGERMGAPTSSTLTTTVSPGQTVDITVNMTAPASAGHYFGYYKFNSASGGMFGIGSTANKAFWVEIYVGSSGGGVGYDFTANAASAAWSSGSGSLSFPGNDGNAYGFAFRQANPTLENGIGAGQAGLLFAPNNVTNGYIQAVYPAFRVQSGDRFQATIGCEYGSTSCYVAYRLDYQIGSNPVRTFWTFREKYEGWSYNVNLDLSSLVGQDVKFIPVISAYGSPIGDRAIWVNPVISRAGVIVTSTPTLTGTPPTSTPTQSATPVPWACDRAQFVADVTVPDGTTYQPNTSFSKTWRLKNVGTCVWSNYSLMFDSGEKMGGPDSAVIPATVAPGQTVDITISLTAPATTGGLYRGYWKLKNSSGIPFGIGYAGTKSFWVEIRTAGTPVTPITPVAPVTPATPIPGTVYDFAANVCTATWSSGAGTQPCPGSEGNANGFVLIASPSRLENGTIDNRTGLILQPQNITNGYIQGQYPTYKVKSGDRFRATVNCEYGATSCYAVLRLDYIESGSSTVKSFWAFVENYEGQYYNANIDLTALVGKDVNFILGVNASGSATGDRVLWVAPIIYNAGAVNAAPVITSSAAASVAENVTTVTTVTATDSDTLTYSIKSGGDGGLFNINASSGQVTFISAPNYEAPTDAGANNVYNFTVQVSDGTNAVTQDLAVTVTDVNEAPAFTSSATTTNSENSFDVIKLAASDPDLPAQTLTFSIVGGVDKDFFTLNSSTGQLAFIYANPAPNFEDPKDANTDNVYLVTVQVSDGTNNVTQAFSVTVTDVAD